MAKEPLFGQPELAAAFRLILPDDTAAHDDVGRFLYQDWHEAAGLPSNYPSVVARETGTLTSTEREAAEAAFFSAMSTAKRVEYLMRFSDFHYALVAVVSDDLYERMKHARGMRDEQAARNRRQMLRIVAAMQTTGGHDAA